LSLLLSRRTRGLYMSVQQTFGGASRVAFPIGTGLVMDRIGLGIPFFGAAVLVLLLLQLSRGTTRTAAVSAGDPARATPAPSVGW